MAPVKKVPRWDDDPENGTPECSLHWFGQQDNARLVFWMGHPDRLSLRSMGDRTWLVDEWTDQWQILKPGCLIVIEKGGRAVVV